MSRDSPLGFSFKLKLPADVRSLEALDCREEVIGTSGRSSQRLNSACVRGVKHVHRPQCAAS